MKDARYDQRLRTVRRRRADAVWACHGGRPGAVTVAAYYLDREGWEWMADDLLRLWPHRLRQVGAVIAADALAQGQADAWDCLVIGGAVDAGIALDRFDEFSSGASYAWEPSPDDLIS